MKPRWPAALVAAILCLLGAVSPARATHRHHAVVDTDASDNQDVAISGKAYVAKGQVHEGDVVAIFGDARIEGEVTGDVVVIMGDLDLSGSVGGDVVSILSHAKIADSAKIAGDLVNVGWTPEGEVSRAQVDGEIVNVNCLSLIPFAGKGVGWSGLMRLLFVLKLMKMAALFLIILLITALVPRRLATIAAAFPQRWGYAILAGLLAYAGLAVASVLLAVTIIGIPLAVALVCALLVIKWLGVASILFLIGQTAGRNLFQRDLPHVASVLGGFVAYAILCLIPVFGFAFSLGTSIVAVGIAILTRFGSEEPWRRGGAAAAAAPAHASGTVPPAAPDTAPPRL